MSELLTWSTTANSNNSTPPDGFPESMFPSQVNDAAREMMAAIARLCDRMGLRFINLGFDATVGSNNLTVSLKTASAANPASTDPVTILFRSTTETTGQRVAVDYSAATSVVLPGGGSLGFVNSETGQIYVWAVYDGTNKDIGISRTSNFNESTLQSTTAVDTNSDATNVIYTTSARTNAAVTLIGVITIQYGTAAWTNSPTNKTVWIYPATGSLLLTTSTFAGILGLSFINLGFTAAVASNDLTITLKTAAGNNPTSSDSVPIFFRSTSATTGQRVAVNYDITTSVVLPGGGSLGFANSETGYAFIWAVYDGTNKDIGISRSINFDESALHSTTTIGTGSDATNVIYTTTGRSNAAVNLIGRITIQYGTAAWTNAPTNLMVWKMGMTREVTGSYTGTLTGLTTSPTTTINFSIMGDVVTLVSQASVTGTSNTTAFTITGGPAIITPSTASGGGFALLRDNGANIRGEVTMNTSGTLVFSILGSTTGFTSSGTKGLPAAEALSFTYKLTNP